MKVVQKGSDFLKNNPDKLFREVCTITNNIDEYISKGYKIDWDLKNSHLIINYKGSMDYYVSIVKKNDNKDYWYLTPYNKSYFSTSYENGFDIVLFAIKENEELCVERS